MRILETILTIIITVIFIFIITILIDNYFIDEKKTNTKDKWELKYDSLLQVKSCYCKKLEFLDTLSDKEIETAFKKSRCKIL